MSDPRHELGKQVTTATGDRGHIVDRRQTEAGDWLYGIATDRRHPVTYYLAEGIGPGTFRGMSHAS